VGRVLVSRIGKVGSTVSLMERNQKFIFIRNHKRCYFIKTV